VTVVAEVALFLLLVGFFAGMAGPRSAGRARRGEADARVATGLAAFAELHRRRRARTGRP
jgi:hypothetical protein